MTFEQRKIRCKKIYSDQTYNEQCSERADHIEHQQKEIYTDVFTPTQLGQLWSILPLSSAHQLCPCVTQAQ